MTYLMVLEINITFVVDLCGRILVHHYVFSATLSDITFFPCCLYVDIQLNFQIYLTNLVITSQSLTAVSHGIAMEKKQGGISVTHIKIHMLMNLHYTPSTVIITVLIFSLYSRNSSSILATERNF